METYSVLKACFFILFFCQNVITEEDSEETFLYFAYGSNLLAKRIHIKNPTAEFFSIAKLPNFRLDFQCLGNLEYWNGAVATIVEDSDSVVWGALWTLKIRDIPNLDAQEGVHVGMYRVMNVTVQTPDGESITARTYQMTMDPPKVPAQHLPLERQPSSTYMEVIIRGAFECSLPINYIRYLFTFLHNGKLARADAREQLGNPFNLDQEFLNF